MPQPQSWALPFFSHFTSKNEFYGPIFLKRDWEMKYAQDDENQNNGVASSFL